jgi:hypothetical protein
MCSNEDFHQTWSAYGTLSQSPTGSGGPNLIDIEI